ncbi:MFS transporter [Novosphingobium sediminicola]|uniref:MFS family permease n=1 Tax=Novosphingobium sediminicola TaxID=563162 RepID=A0A7W6G9Z1_9SPHN|nr:MFS transporter [Novosphingobium sediminicola]MBB3957567.1 MFS family permease [Novosphingobium sediminicola]
MAKGITLVYAQILPVMAIVSLFPAIPKLFQQFGNIPMASLLVPMIVTVPSLFVALTAPFAGVLADRFGRRRIFVWGITAYLIMGLVPILTEKLGLIVASRAVLGIAEACVVTVSSALIGDYFGEQRHKWVSMVGIAITIAGMVLLAAGGALADISWRGPFAIYLFVVPAVIMAWLYIDEPPVYEKQQAGDGEVAVPPYPWRIASVIGAVTLLCSLIYYVMPLNFAAALGMVGITSSTTVGLMQAASNIGYLIGALTYRRIHDWHVTRLLALSSAAMGAGMLVLSFSTTLNGVIVSSLIQQFGAGFVIPVLMAWGQALLPVTQRGRVMGIWVTSFFTGTFLCPPMITGLSALLGGLYPAVGAVGVAGLITALGAFALRERQNNTH